MRIGIIGKGQVGSALCAGWQKAGYDVRTSDRSADPRPRDLAAWADLLVLAVPYSVLVDVSNAIGPAKGKIVVDCTNPIERGPKGLGLSVGLTTSGAERLQSLLPGAKVVKTLNQVGAEIMADAKEFQHPPVQFLAGDHAEAKETVARLLLDLGFEPLDAGDLSKARLLEPFALVWINQAVAQGKGRDWAFGAMRRSRDK